jgi:hypothetical protein
MVAGPHKNSVSGKLRHGRLTHKGPDRPLTRLQPNLSYLQAKGAWWIHGVDTLPATFPLVQSVSRQLPQGELSDDSWTEVYVVRSLCDSVIDSLAASPSGTVQRSRGPDIVIDRDNWFRRIFLTDSTNLDGVGAWKSLPVIERRVARWENPEYQPLLPTKPSMFVGGLISLSAEPPEGFFAAATSAEFQSAGYPLEQADKARVWLYRVPDSRTQSYFDFLYASPDRPFASDRSEKFLIASGVGPASDPASVGGRECSLLWLGDEQHGPLQTYLADLGRPLHLRDLALAHKGFGQKLPDNSVLLSGINSTHNLSKEGFDGLQTEPEIYRRVFSEEYDEFLMSLFEPQSDETSVASYLLATSRGCTQGCSICCSGGLKSFQSFSGERMMKELEALAKREDSGVVDIFFLDSNFNNNPKRIVDFARLYSESHHFKRFRFYVRHNTVKGFLRRQGRENVPNHELIDAFSMLGIREVFMGVDTFDEASTLTLKSNRVQLARRGDGTSAAYTPKELRALVASLEERGLVTRGFYLQNNPWVSDFDRLESYYHIADLWFNFPHFSIDTRERAVNQLKPFAGSPIEQVDRLAGNAWTDNGRFVTRSALGELDELMTVSYFGTPQYRSNANEAARLFILEMDKVRERVEASGDPQLLAKLVDLDAVFSLHPLITTVARTFATRWSHLPKFDPNCQKRAFQEASRPLFEGLSETVPQAMMSNGNRDRLQVSKKREPVRVPHKRLDTRTVEYEPVLE